MEKKYAVVSPAYSFMGDVGMDLLYFVIAPIHKLCYERVYGYSLGHQVQFYDSLDEAKKSFYFNPNSGFFNERVQQNAIVEMEYSKGALVNFCTIHTVSQVKKEYRSLKSDSSQFIKTKKLIWSEHEITSVDCTEKALAEMNGQLMQRK